MGGGAGGDGGMRGWSESSDDEGGKYQLKMPKVSSKVTVTSFKAKASKTVSKASSQDIFLAQPERPRGRDDKGKGKGYDKGKGKGKDKDGKGDRDRRGDRDRDDRGGRRDGDRRDGDRR